MTFRSFLKCPGSELVMILSQEVPGNSCIRKWDNEHGYNPQLVPVVQGRAVMDKMSLLFPVGGGEGTRHYTEKKDNSNDNYVPHFRVGRHCFCPDCPSICPSQNCVLSLS